MEKNDGSMKKTKKLLKSNKNCSIKLQKNLRLMILYEVMEKKNGSVKNTQKLLRNNKKYN